MTREEQRQYNDGYEMGRAGVKMESHDPQDDSFISGHEDGWADYWSEAYGDDADLCGVGLMII